MIIYNQDVIYQYIYVLQLLKEATIILKGRGRSRYNSAIQEVLPIYNQLLSKLKGIKDYIKDTTREEFPLAYAIEDYIKQNITRGYIKLSKYYKLTSKTLVYYIAIVLHPRLKHYYRTIQANKLNQLTNSNILLQKLQIMYKNRLLVTLSTIYTIYKVSTYSR